MRFRTIPFTRSSAKVLAVALWTSSPSPASPSFESDILPILKAHCLECHGADTVKSGLFLESIIGALRGGDSGEMAIVPGKSGASHLIERVASGDEKFRMPPKGAPLSSEQIATLRDWIDDAPAWETAAKELDRNATDHWSFQPPVRTAPPENGHTHPLDAFLAGRLAAEGLEFNPPAEPGLLARRMSLATTGLLPTAEEQKALAGLSPAELADHFLASPHFGERWATHWMDVVRFAESDGFETNHDRPNAYHYRDWLIRAFNEDKPYDRFVTEQIAGDAFGEDAATGFLVAGPWDRVKGQDGLLAKMQRQDELAGMVNTTGTAFLGLTFGCAMCHNHKFDPISQTDFFAIQATLSGVQHGERPLRAKSPPKSAARLLAVGERIAAIESQIAQLQPSPIRGHTQLVDESDPARTATLAPLRGEGVNPDGADRGHKGDPGAPGHFPNVSGGRYSWWTNTPGQDVFAWRPSSPGLHRIWISWGSGHATHSEDARYILDIDGDPATKDDQSVIATVDQRHFAGGAEGEIPGKALWSGFHDAGVHELQASSAILLRGGDTGTAITADVLLLQSPEAGMTRPRLRPPASAAGNSDSFSPVLAAAVRFTITATNDGNNPCIDELEIWSAGERARNVAGDGTPASSGDYSPSDIHKLAHINDGQFGNPHSWISNQAGQGWVEIKLATPTLIERVSWARDRDRVYADRLPVGYRIEVAQDAKGPWTTVASSSERAPFGSPPSDALAYDPSGLPASEAKQVQDASEELASLRQERAALSEFPTAYVGRFVQPGEPTRRLFRGDPLTPKEPVAPDGLSVLAPKLGTFGLAADAPERERRLALARWITHPENPLTARVIVNRLWHYHFGQGLVASPSDFGAMGFAPTHPELLDWLATELVANGWSLKHIHRLILTSHAYRQSSAPRSDALKKDAGARWLWRFPPRRLEAEAIRDNILLVSETLDHTMFGPGYLLFEPNSNYARNWIPKEEFGPADYRRMIYATKIRMERDAIFGAFDCPDAGSVTPSRGRSTTPIQAMNLYNSPFVLTQAEALAGRVQKHAGPDVESQVVAAFEFVFGRRPDAGESEDAAALARQHGLPQLCRALFNANEFLFLQ